MEKKKDIVVVFEREDAIRKDGARKYVAHYNFLEDSVGSGVAFGKAAAKSKKGGNGDLAAFIDNAALALMIETKNTKSEFSLLTFLKAVQLITFKTMDALHINKDKDKELNALFNSTRKWSVEWYEECMSEGVMKDIDDFVLKKVTMLKGKKNKK